MQAKLRCAKYMYATTMVTKSGTTMVTKSGTTMVTKIGTTMVAPVAQLPTALSGQSDLADWLARLTPT